MAKGENAEGLKIRFNFRGFACGSGASGRVAGCFSSLLEVSGEGLKLRL